MDKYGPHLAEPRNIELFKGPRILLQRIVSKEFLDPCYLEDQMVCNTDVITLRPKKTGTDCMFYLAIINSSLCANYIKSKNINLDRSAFPKINTQTLQSFPIPDYKQVNLQIRNEIVKLVETMVQLNKEKQQTTTPDKLDQLNARIQYTDDKINKLVYTLYGLNEEEVGIVEGR